MMKITEEAKKKMKVDIPENRYISRSDQISPRSFAYFESLFFQIPLSRSTRDSSSEIEKYLHG